jgi:hypothetical protein
MRKNDSRKKKVCYACAGKWRNGLGWCGLYRPNDDCRLVADNGNSGYTSASMARIHKLVSHRPALLYRKINSLSNSIKGPGYLLRA